MVRPLLGLVLLVVITGMYGLNRAAQYSELPKAEPPRAKQVGDDFARLAQATNDPRSVYLVIGQALYDLGPGVSRIEMPFRLTSMLAYTSRPGGPTVPKATARNRIMLLTGIKPVNGEQPPRLDATQTAEALRAGSVESYPMNVSVVRPAEGVVPSSWAVVGSADGSTAIILPSETLESIVR